MHLTAAYPRGNGPACEDCGLAARLINLLGFGNHGTSFCLRRSRRRFCQRNRALHPSDPYDQLLPLSAGKMSNRRGVHGNVNSAKTKDNGACTHKGSCDGRFREKKTSQFHVVKSAFDPKQTFSLATIAPAFEWRGGPSTLELQSRNGN